ncbi:WbqC family protein [Aequorivita sp. KMM 9714]|uniref:WbqC family protein n=1 Tax=Aequorivita sp. KMM 9714 TaxID=2707173 RepID=UPI0013ED5642|nr:WbqC family protein [Aequorivita sp. KMM 9714]NGX84748.1 WbqC family protein [Aequorivita sp. KMM 9714]
MKKIGIMQPYFLPYIGYFQLMEMVDEFVIYDNIEFSKASWIRRNRMLQNGKDAFFTLPIKKDSDFLDVDQRYLADNFDKEAGRLLRRIEANYSKAPYFNDFFPVVQEIIFCKERNLFDYILNSVYCIKDYLKIETPIKVFSKLGKDVHLLRAQDKVIGVCKALQATHYINSFGGKHLYDSESFQKENLQLLFFRTSQIEYSQFENDFIPFLSIMDVCMFNDVSQVREYLKHFEIINP